MANVGNEKREYGTSDAQPVILYQKKTEDAKEAYPLIGQGGIESAVNSSTTLLASGGTFQGTGEQNSNPHVGVYCFSDVSGQLYFEWSVDGTNWHDFPTQGYKVSASIPEFHTAVKMGRYFRTRFDMDAGSQTEFRITTYYGSNFLPSASPLNAPIGLDSDAQLVRPTFPWLDVVRGLTSGITFINKFGRNPACAANETIWALSTTIGTIASAGVINVSSSSSDDTLTSGSGAWTVKVFGLDENYALAEETVSLNGTASTTTTNSYWFVYRAYVATASTQAGAVGNLSFTSTVGSIAMAYIGVGFNQTQIANYQIPAGYTGYFNLPQVTLQNTNNNAVLHLGLFKREFGGVDRIQTDFLLQSGATSDYQQKEFGAPLTFNEKDMIYWKVISVSGGGTFNVTVDYDIWLVNET